MCKLPVSHKEADRTVLSGKHCLALYSRFSTLVCPCPLHSVMSPSFCNNPECSCSFFWCPWEGSTLLVENHWQAVWAWHHLHPVAGGEGVVLSLRGKTFWSLYLVCFIQRPGVPCASGGAVPKLPGTLQRTGAVYCGRRDLPSASSGCADSEQDSWLV